MDRLYDEEGDGIDSEEEREIQRQMEEEEEGEYASDEDIDDIRECVCERAVMSLRAEVTIR